MSMTFTFKERTVRDRTVAQAVKQARDVLDTRHNGILMCTNALKGYDYDDKITVEKLSQLVETLIDDSVYYAYS